MERTAIITGITGQDGAYLSRLLLENGYRVIGLVRTDTEENLFGLNYLGILDQVTLRRCDLLELNDIETALKDVRPDEIYNLAAQSSVGFSFEKPMETVPFNVLSVLNLLETIRKVNPSIRYYQASSSDMFGNIDSLPVTENTVIHPTSPYGISKAAGHWLAVNYRESYGIFACCGILFNHESYLRTDNFFVKKVIRTAIEIKNGAKDELRVGNIDLRRDFGYAPDYVRAMWLMMQKDSAKDYLICSGQSVSLREIAEHVFEKLEIAIEKIVVDEKFYRPNDITNIFGTNEMAKIELGWEYEKTFFEVLDELIEEEIRNT